MSREADLQTLRRRRGVVRSSLTKLVTKTAGLESGDDPLKRERAEQALVKLKALDEEFRTLHFQLIDKVEDEDSLAEQQDILDQEEEDVAEMRVKLTQLAKPTPTTRTEPSVGTGDLEHEREIRVLERKLKHADSALHRANKTITSLDGAKLDKYLIRQCREQLDDVKGWLRDTRRDMLSTELEEGGKLQGYYAELEGKLFDMYLKVSRIGPESESVSDTRKSSEHKSVKLPKIEVPSFDGNILHWTSFWEQFSIAVHDRTDLANSEKYIYLQHALKNGSAKVVIDGLNQSGENYGVAVECLKSRYDRPRLIHQAHVKILLDFTPLKEGSGRELRKLHDVAQQHIRALQSMGCDPAGPFMTSLLELKLDPATMFEWQKHTQSKRDVPAHVDLLNFINLRAQAAESSTMQPAKKLHPKHDPVVKRSDNKPKQVTTFTANFESSSQCLTCKADKHPLYVCPTFRNMNHAEKMGLLKEKRICVNCLNPGHFAKSCKSIHRCKRCHRAHHTLLHVEEQKSSESAGGDSLSTSSATLAANDSVPTVPASSSTTTRMLSGHVATPQQTNSLLMTCKVSVIGPNRSSVEARALLDNGSSVSFVSERVAQYLRLPRSGHNLTISGIAGLQHKATSQAVAKIQIAPVMTTHHRIDVTAVILPRVTCDLPQSPILHSSNWEHLSGLTLADPEFDHPGKIDVLLGVDVFSDVLRQGRRSGSPGAPTAFETIFGWVLCGNVTPTQSVSHFTTLHALTASGNDILHRFWEVEEQPQDTPFLSHEEREVVNHFNSSHYRKADGRFVVPLPRNQSCKPIGESRTQAVRRFLSLEKSLRAHSRFEEFEKVMMEYLDMGHAEPVPVDALDKPVHQVFYLPMHAVYKNSSTTTKIRAVFDASAKSSTGVSLNDTLMVGPTVHPPLLDVLLRFRRHRVALTGDISKMYRAIELTEQDRDFHRFVWRSSESQSLCDYRMTRVTFGVSASSFAANMSVKRNADDYALEYPLAAKAVKESFYVDDTLTGADTLETAVELQKQLQSLFARAGFLLRKWNSSDDAVLSQIPPDLRDSESTQSISDTKQQTKTLGVVWHTRTDMFTVDIADLPPLACITKRALISDVAKTFDVLGWFAPTIIQVKILFQKLWERKVDWDEIVPDDIKESWLQWRQELPLLKNKQIERCYFPKHSNIVSTQIHGFCDASEDAYSGVVYLRMLDSESRIHVSLVIAKTKVAPIKRLTIPRLELCGAHLLSHLVRHVKDLFQIPMDDVFMWTDSTIVLGWLSGNPRHLKTFVGNRVSYIMDQISTDRWRHVSSADNPADCASRGLFPSQLIQFDLWWHGPHWLSLDQTQWPNTTDLSAEILPEAECNVCLTTSVSVQQPLFPFDKFSSFTKFKRVTAWVIRFLDKCRKRAIDPDNMASSLLIPELVKAENYWISLIQQAHFSEEVERLKARQSIPSSSNLMSLSPFLDEFGVLRVGGRVSKSNVSYLNLHPIILHGKHVLTRVIIRTEHLRLLHAGLSLLIAELQRRYHIVLCRKTVRSVLRTCVPCLRRSVKPQTQLLGQLPAERVSPDSVFNNVGVDYAGPLHVKYGTVRKPTVLKAYVCIFVSLSVKAVHLELVSDLTAEAFIAALRRFVARRGHPTMIWSDHGTNFVGANREMREFSDFLDQQRTQGLISEFCSSRHITWKFIPEHSPHFGGLWEASVKSFKMHLRKVVAGNRLTFEEMSTVLMQIEACLNSRPLTPLSSNTDGVEALTPGHFLIGRSLMALPDTPLSYRPITLLKRWDLCQNLVRHFWQRWSCEYLTSLNRLTKWRYPKRNVSIGDVVVLREDNLVPTKWPLARVVQVYSGKDNLVRVVLVKTSQGTYKRPITKIAVILPSEN